MKILVIEDDLAVADALKQTLSCNNYAVEIANDGEAGLAFIEAFSYDLILLDVLLPKLDGISICRHVRSRGYMMPILLLTSRDGNHDRAVGLDAGADDYVVKPFDCEELSARIRALLRRGTDSTSLTLTWEDLTLDPRNCEVTYRGNLLTLTPKEYVLLELFLRHNRRVFSCGAILEHLWTYEDMPSEEAVRTHIKELRKKLKAVGAPTDLLETVYGIGYRLKPTIANVLPVVPKSNPRQMLADIWYKHRNQTIERVDSIELVAMAILDRSLTEEIRLNAWRSAHNLAGALGTFGLTLGSQAAKKIELLLEDNLNLSVSDIPQLQMGIAQLRQEIDRKIEETIEATSPSLPPNGATKVLAIVKDLGLIESFKSATTAKLAIESSTELSEHQLNPPPQVILLDLDCFPHLEAGLTALAGLNRDYPTIPVLVLSQLTESLNLRIEVARQGGRIFLSKPTTVSQILLAVDLIRPQVPLSRAKILIVDDDQSILEKLCSLLSPQGMTVTTLSEPSQFWSVLEACSPDLLILDLDMPTHNGIELCQAVRTDAKWATLPIMFLTAHTASLAIDRVFAAGADDFATKSVFGSALVNRIIRRLERTTINTIGLAHSIGVGEAVMTK